MTASMVPTADETVGVDESRGVSTAPAADPGGRGMRVELLQYEGCPLAPAALHLVRQCLIALGAPDPVLVRVGDYPSPTVLVNGADVMGGAAELSKARVCRVDVPNEERVLVALRAALAI